MVSRIGLRPLWVCSALLAASQLGFGQIKVAVINMQQAVLGTAEISKANEDMQATFKPRSDKITQLSTEGQAEVDQLQKNESKMTQQQVSDLQYDIQKKQRELKNLQDDLQTDTDAYRNDVLQKSSAKMSEVVKKLAEEKGIDLVVEAQGTVYFKPALDITKDAIAAYDKTYPAKAAAPGPAAAK